MANYTKITPGEANRILALYGLPEVLLMECTGHGISNTNYNITLVNREKILLKISNDKNVSQLEEEQQILSFIRKASYPYSLIPFETLTKKNVYQWNSFHGVIYPFVSGGVLPMTQERLNQLGNALALLHQVNISVQEKSNLRSAASVGFTYPEIIKFTQSTHCPDDFKQAFLYTTKIFSSLESLQENFLPSGLIHGDLYSDNALFDEQGQLLTLLDFEQAGFGCFLFDLGICISGSCLEAGKIKLDLLKALLHGYKNKRELTTLEQSVLPAAIALGFLSISLWRIHRFYLGTLSAEKKMSYQELLHYLTNYLRDYHQLSKQEDIFNG
jgi:homoserine kinase type II